MALEEVKKVIRKKYPGVKLGIKIYIDVEEPGKPKRRIKIPNSS